jgi:hypothetical protein
LSLVGVPEGEERKGQKKMLEEIMGQHFPNLVKNNLCIQETPSGINSRRLTQRHVIVNC